MFQFGLVESLKLCFSLVWLSCMVDSLKLCFSWIVEVVFLFCLVELDVGV